MCVSVCVCECVCALALSRINTLSRKHTYTLRYLTLICANTCTNTH